MANTTYATVAELEVRVNTGSEDPSDNTLLQQYLDTAAWMVDELTRGWRQGYEAFSGSAEEERVFDDYGTGTVEIDDLLTPSVVTRGGTDITTDYYKLYPYNSVPKTEIRLRRDLPSYQSEAGYWYGAPVRGIGTAQVAITGIWGYCTATNRPPIVKELTLQLAELMYMEMGLSDQELMAALRNPVTDKQKRIVGLAEMLKRKREVVLA